MKLTELTESKDTLNPPSISVGDEVKVGKFKNRKAEVKGFKTDDNGQPVLKTTKGDQKLYKPRVSKLEPVKEDVACKSCGDTGTVHWDSQNEFTGDHEPASAPCPDCSNFASIAQQVVANEIQIATDEQHPDLKNRIAKLKKLATITDRDKFIRIYKRITGATDYDLPRELEEAFVTPNPAEQLAQIFTNGGLQTTTADIESYFQDGDSEGAISALASRAMMNLSNYEEFEHEIDSLLSDMEFNLEESDTKLEVDFDPANYKTVIKNLQDREISGKKKAAFLKSRIMRDFKSGNITLSNVIGMMDKL